MNTQPYIDPVFSLDNIDRYYVRKSIFNALMSNKHLLNGKLLDVGCGVMPYKKSLLSPSGFAKTYTGLDLDISVTEGYAAVKPDLTWDGTKIPLDNETVDSILLTEVLEHCFEPFKILQECNRVLKNDCAIVITVPFLWPLHDIPYDEYRYTPFSINKLLKNSGFTDINITALGGWNASLAQMLGLWLNRSGIGGWRRTMLFNLFLKHAYKWLLKNDRIPKNFVDNSEMYTGLCITAKKRS